MKNFLKQFSALLLIAVFVSAVIFSGCKKKDEPAPDLLPISTFQMDYALDTNNAGNKDMQSSLNFLLRTSSSTMISNTAIAMRNVI